MFEIGIRETALVGGGVAGSLEIYAPLKEAGLGTPIDIDGGGFASKEPCDIGGAVTCTIATVTAVGLLAVNPFAGALAVLAALQACKDGAKDSAGCTSTTASSGSGDGDGDGGA